MVKVEGTRLTFKMSGNRAELSLAEHEYSLHEWDQVRTAAFARLRKDGFIPNELLDLVEHFNERTVVQPLFGKTADGAGITLGIKVPGKKTKKTEREIIAEIAEYIAVGKRRILDDRENELTASEALAFFLRICLRDLKYAVRRGNAAPVRTEKLVPRSVIGWVATDLLGSCELWNYSPGPHLNALIRELLNVDTDKAGAIRHADEQEEAAFIIAQYPEVHTRELARGLHINASTISRWRRNPQFKEKVERKAQWIASLKCSGRWDAMIDSAERT
jgi:hypothetical protein